MGKEIEIKLPLLNESEVKKYLDSHADFLKNEMQTDIYFDSDFLKFTKNIKAIDTWIRLRKEQNEVTLNYKHWLPEDQPIKTHCNEYEVVISSFDAMLNIFDALGFSECVRVVKQRNSWIFSGCEISIDTVDELGSFIEIESKRNAINIEEERDYLFDVLKIIAAKTDKLDLKGYPYQILELKRR